MSHTFQLQVDNLQTEVTSLREAGAGGYFQAISLPEGMTPSSSDVIASLNEHLVQTLHVSCVKIGHISAFRRVNVADV